MSSFQKTKTSSMAVCPIRVRIIEFNRDRPRILDAALEAAVNEEGS